jgi:hypothetical protein
MKMESRANHIAALSISFFISAAAFTAAQQPRVREQPQAREQRTELPKIVLIHGKGGAAPKARPREMRVAAPPPLSENEKRALIKSAGFQQAVNPHDSFKLTPSNPSHLPQAWLAFQNPMLLDSEFALLSVGNQNSFVDIRAGTNKSVGLQLRAAAGKNYLIDFSVTGNKFYLYVPVGDAKETFSGTDHVLIAFESASDTLAGFILTGEGAAGSWEFHSCEVTPLN